VISNSAQTRSWLVLRKGFQVRDHVFFVQKKNVSIACKKVEQHYVLFFSSYSHAERCWEIINRSGRWSGVLDLNDGFISYPEDLIDESRLREIAEQYVDGKSRFVWSDEEDYWGEEDYWDEEEEWEVDNRPRRGVRALWQGVLKKVLGGVSRLWREKKFW
jgi:hypothetical protein